jgi:hypothetical protein
MFIAHYAVALAAKKAAPRVSLGTQALAVVALAAWLFVPWAYWINRHRRAAAA